LIFRVFSVACVIFRGFPLFRRPLTIGTAIPCGGAFDRSMPLPIDRSFVRSFVGSGRLFVHDRSIDAVIGGAVSGFLWLLLSACFRRPNCMLLLLDRRRAAHTFLPLIRQPFCCRLHPTLRWRTGLAAQDVTPTLGWRSGANLDRASTYVLAPIFYLESISSCRDDNLVLVLGLYLYSHQFFSSTLLAQV